MASPGHSELTCYMLKYFEDISMAYINGLVQDCSYSSALAMELQQSCAKPLL